MNDIDAEELRPNPRKIAGINKLSPPENIQQLRQIIDLVSYFH